MVNICLNIYQEFLTNIIKWEVCLAMEEEVLYVVSKISKVPKEELNLDSELFNSNLVSSLGLLEMVDEVEKKYKITIKPEELIHDNFGTIHKMIDFIVKKTNK